MLSDSNRMEFGDGPMQGSKFSFKQRKNDSD